MSSFINRMNYKPPKIKKGKVELYQTFPKVFTIFVNNEIALILVHTVIYFIDYSVFFLLMATSPKLIILRLLSLIKPS